MREALKPFADIAAHEELQDRFADERFPINLGLMNGNVTQAVIRDKLHVSDFRRAAEALRPTQTEKGNIDA